MRFDHVNGTIETRSENVPNGFERAKIMSHHRISSVVGNEMPRWQNDGNLISYLSTSRNRKKLENFDTCAGIHLILPSFLPLVSMCIGVARTSLEYHRR